MNRFLTVSVLCGGLVMGAAYLRAEADAKPAGDTASTNKAVATAKAQTTCPVMKGNPIDKTLYVDAEGKRIYVCCAGCIDAVKKNPSKYIKKLEAQGVVLEATPAAKPADTAKPAAKTE